MDLKHWNPTHISTNQDPSALDSFTENAQDITFLLACLVTPSTKFNLFQKVWLFHSIKRDPPKDSNKRNTPKYP